MRLTFHGAAQEVTGSMHLLEVNGQRILLDCGLYQGRRGDTYARNLNFPWEAEGTSALAEELREQGHGNVVAPTLHGSFEF
ncbi:MAG: hypothetical protein OXO48_10795 [Caldilineaceae bacterium]|nr:hypothetical protein [Caldilineaceae bacterium]